MNQEKNSGLKFLWTLTIVAMIIGLIGLFDRLTNGHVNANYGSYVPWGLWVAGYIYLIGLSAGAFVMSALVYVFNVKALEKVGKLALLTALATLIGAMLSIWLDLGHMGRVWRMIVHTHFGSVMGWMSWLYGFYFILLSIEFWFAMRVDVIKWSTKKGLSGKLSKLLSFGSTDISNVSKLNDKRKLKILGSIGIPLAIAFHGSVGAIFGSVGARAYWNSGLTPIIFLIGAFLSGAALLTFVIYNWGPEKGSKDHTNVIILIGKIILGLLAFDVLLEYAEITIGLWASIPADSDSLKLILFGEFWWVFWFIHVGLGIIVPAFLLITGSKDPKKIAIAGLLIAVTFITVRLNIVIPGLAIPELEGLRTAFTGPGLTFDYVPSLMEWSVFIFTIASAGLVFLVGRTFLPVIEVDKELEVNQ